MFDSIPYMISTVFQAFFDIISTVWNGLNECMVGGELHLHPDKSCDTAHEADFILLARLSAAPNINRSVSLSIWSNGISTLLLAIYLSYKIEDFFSSATYYSYSLFRML